MFPSRTRSYSWSFLIFCDSVCIYSSSTGNTACKLCLLLQRPWDRFQGKHLNLQMLYTSGICRCSLISRVLITCANTLWLVTLLLPYISSSEIAGKCISTCCKILLQLVKYLIHAAVRIFNVFSKSLLSIRISSKSIPRDNFTVQIFFFFALCFHLLGLVCWQFLRCFKMFLANIIEAVYPGLQIYWEGVIRERLLLKHQSLVFLNLSFAFISEESPWKNLRVFDEVSTHCFNSFIQQ